MPKMGLFTPAPHKTTHQDAGDDELDVTGLAGGYSDAQASAVAAALIATHAAVAITHGATDAIADQADIATHAALVGLHTKIVRKTADEVINNVTTPQNDDELKFDALANEIWWFSLVLRHTRHASAGYNNKINWSIPTAASLLSEIPAGSVNEIDATSAVEIPTVSTFIRRYHNTYLYIGGANAGTIQLQWCQAGSEAYTYTVNANSIIIAHRLA